MPISMFATDSARFEGGASKEPTPQRELDAVLDDKDTAAAAESRTPPPPRTEDIEQRGWCGFGRVAGPNITCRAAARDNIREELVFARMELDEAKLEEIDVESILAFATYVIGDPARLWDQATADETRHSMSVCHGGTPGPVHRMHHSCNNFHSRGNREADGALCRPGLALAVRPEW
jgi:hypothetical protein